VNKLKLPERRAKRVEPMAIEDPEKVLGVDPIDPEEFERERRKQKKHKKRHHRDEVVAKFDGARVHTSSAHARTCFPR
jgi:hypothetical protein